MTLEPCDRCEEILQDFLDRTLSNEEWAEAETHLVDCDYCRRRYRFEETLRRYVKLERGRADAPGADGEARRASRARRDRLALPQVLGRVDVAGRPEVVAGDEPDRELSEPFVGHAVPVSATEHERMPAGTRVGRGDDSSLFPPGFEHALDGCRGRDRARPRGRPRLRRRRPASASSPQRSEAPGPRPHRSHRDKAERTPCDSLSLGSSSSYAPCTTTISSTGASPSRSSTRGRSSRCLGEPKRVASPAARTTAAMRPISFR